MALGLEGLDRKSYCLAGQYCIILICSKDIILGTTLEDRGKLLFLMKAQQVIASVEAFNLALKAVNESVAEVLGFGPRNH